MVATPITHGLLTNLILDSRLSGKLELFNNGIAEPNLSGEAEIFGTYRGGMLSNGLPFNEHADGGVVDFGQGALRMLVTVASGGPNKGGEKYHLDERLNWRLKTDLALDPGYPEGLVISQNLDISSGALRVGPSRQTEAGLPGGFDYADSLPTNALIIGALGDSDDDGFLDGRIVGASRVPLKFIFVPGAPIVMSRTIVSDIPVTPKVSGILELAGVANLTLVLKEPNPKPGSRLDVYYRHMLPEWAADFAARARRAATRLQAIQAPEAELASQIATVLEAALVVKTNRLAYKRQVASALVSLEAALPGLVQAFEAETAVQ
jgi:hypothetical protein